MHKSDKNKIKSIFLFIIILSLALIIPSIGNPIFKSKVYATDEDLYEELKKLEQELAKIKKDKLNLDQKIDSEKNLQNTLSYQIYKLANSITGLELDIQEKEVDIEKKETEIKILEYDITEASEIIDNMNNDVNKLQTTAENIIMTIYIESKTNSAIDILLTSDETKSFVSQIQYHTALGTYDQNALMNLQSEKQTLENQKQKLEDDKLEIETLTEQIKIQKENLEKDKENLSAQKVQKNQLLQNSQVAAEYYKSQYDNLTDEEIKKEAQLDYILQQLIDSATKPKGYVVKGQKIAVQASNGCSTGPHTHLGLAVDGVWSNPCSYLTYYNFTWIECGGDGSIRYPYNGTFYMSQYYKSYHQALDLVAGSDKYVYASHDGYFFEENAPCSNSWCRVGCKTSTNPCAKVCEDISCKKGKTTIYCHVNFL